MTTVTRIFRGDFTDDAWNQLEDLGFVRRWNDLGVPIEDGASPAAREPGWQTIAPVTAAFNPDQPRDPAGSPTGGQWTSVGGATIGHPSTEAQAPHPDAPDSQQKWIGPDGRYVPARRTLHDGLVIDALKNGKPQPGQATTLFLAGGSGAGKSTILYNELGGGPSDSVVINPDDFKQKLPEYQQMVAHQDPGAAGYVHEESSDLGARTLREANAANMNVVVDGTGDSTPGKFLNKVNAARDAGRHVEVVLVDIPTDEAIKRAVVRANTPGPDYGRMIPPDVIRGYHKSVTQRFTEWAPEVDDWQVWANDDAALGGRRLIARRVAGGPEQVLDQARYDQMLRKADE